MNISARGLVEDICFNLLVSLENPTQREDDGPNLHAKPIASAIVRQRRLIRIKNVTMHGASYSITRID